MRRDLSRLGADSYDVLVIGGGITGAYVAWDAVLRGLRVALVEQGDFGAATSANSLKVIHGGLRYLQQANVRRVRESIQERSALLRTAPHLVRPIPFLVPTYGRFAKGRAAFRAAFAAVDAIGWNRNRGLPGDRAIPGGRVVDRAECLSMFDGFHDRDLSGGALWYDGQAQHPERLTLAVLISAAEHGATLANYLQAEELLVQGGRVRGVRARDRVSGQTLEIRARVVVNAAGPWIHRVLRGTDAGAPPAPRMALAINLVTRRRFADAAVGIRSRTTAMEDPVCGGGRFLFFVPWRGGTLIGTSYLPLSDPQPEVRVTEAMLQSLLDECNNAIQGHRLSLDDLSFHHAGLMPLKQGRERGRPLALAEHARIVDHGRTHRLPGLLTVEGVKFTTARRVAQDAVDRVYGALGRRPPRCTTAEAPVYGGGAPADHAPATKLPRAAWVRLLELHGSRAPSVLRVATRADAGAEPVAPSSSVLRGEVVHAVRSEMALRLSDVVLRRTALGTAACPPAEELEAIAGIMAAELGWDGDQQRREIADLMQSYAPLYPYVHPLAPASA